MKKIRLFFFFLVSAISIYSQTVYETNIKFDKDEYWWGGVVAFGSQMPYIKPIKEFDLSLQNYNNQVVPLFISNQGRYIWSDSPFQFEINESSIIIKSRYEKVEVFEVGKTLRDAYITACEKHFKPSGILPDSLFFTMPQYNTWIELTYNQNQKDILNYAQNIIDNDFPSGVLMIDDNWQNHYGNFEFKADKFPNPKAMVAQLHSMGFKVMLWVCPFVSADSPEYRELMAKGYLIKKKSSNIPAIINWWNGQSACYDLTNPDAQEYFIAQLKEVQNKYGIDGFKFDAGDNSFYNTEFIDSYQKDAKSVDHTLAWARVGLEFPFNEYRAGWQMGGQPLVQRLGDKDYSWNAVNLLVPEIISAGLLGYAYTCPDMIGGGQYGSFIGLDPSKLDQSLIVRSTQVHALMPMMQFSVAPWRILDKKNLSIVRNMAHLHQQFGSYILEYAKQSSKTGEPIVRHMEYSFPNEDFAECKDQFMLGDKYLVAPVVSSKNKRTVRLPIGKWKDDKGKVFKGNQEIEFDIPLDRLLYFEKL